MLSKRHILGWACLLALVLHGCIADSCIKPKDKKAEFSDEKCLKFDVESGLENYTVLFDANSSFNGNSPMKFNVGGCVDDEGGINKDRNGIFFKFGRNKNVNFPANLTVSSNGLSFADQDGNSYEKNCNVSFAPISGGFNTSFYLEFDSQVKSLTADFDISDKNVSAAKSGKAGSSLWIIIGSSVLGAVVLIAVIVAGIYCSVRRRRKQNKDQPEKVVVETLKTAEAKTSETPKDKKSKGSKDEKSKADSKKETPKADSKKETPKADSKKESPKADSKKETPKADSKKETPKADSKKEAPKADSKKETPKADSKKKTPKADNKKEAPKADIKKETPKADNKKEAPKADSKKETPKADSKKETPKADIKNEEPEGCLNPNTDFLPIGIEDWKDWNVHLKTNKHPLLRASFLYESTPKEVRAVYRQKATNYFQVEDIIAYYYGCVKLLEEKAFTEEMHAKYVKIVANLAAVIPILEYRLKVTNEQLKSVEWKPKKEKDIGSE